ncbi:putative effector protein [Ceratobasidium theobromae]|uniref:Putative effector protein n=1 Tax=Ceratobasidium theobromae TaxID=1582974 RepID=A0A5N5Q990_9AGAM|nr:putative effector protein [Ceratobasidium theobromae]
MQFTTVPAFVGASLLAATGVQAGNYGATCSNTRLEGGNIMYATCANGSGSNITSSLNLNACIVNSGGNLRCQANGNYAVSCTGCSVSGTTLRCTCTGRSASINLKLDDCITNRNGILTCP